MAMLILCLFLPVVASLEPYYYAAVEARGGPGMSSGKPYMSVQSLIDLRLDEMKICSKLQKYLIKRKRSKEMTRSIQSYVEGSRKFFKLNNTDEDPLEHPINGFHFLKQLVYQWKPLESSLRQKNSTDKLCRSIIKIRETFPEANDVISSAAAIGRIRRFYQLSFEELKQGMIEVKDEEKVFQSVQPLNSWDCNKIGEGSILVEEYEEAFQWWNIAIDMYEGGDKSVDIEKIYQNQKKAKSQYDKAIVAKAMKTRDYNTFEELAGNATDPANQFKVLVNEKMATDRMAELCRGERQRLKSSLSCRYLTRNHPLLVIRPLKAEEVSKKPAIMIFHDFLTDKEMQTLVDIAAPMLKPSIHGAEDTDDGMLVSLVRTSKQHFLQYTDNPETDYKISARVEAATGLIVASDHCTEPFYVVNYGIGGLYLPHIDVTYATRTEDKLLYRKFFDDRHATLMAFLGNTTYGGATIFPLIGVSVPPEKGSAVLWYNSLKSGEPDLLTIHGGCPVLYGSKWITNKWMYRNCQTFKYSCGPHYLERHTLYGK